MNLLKAMQEASEGARKHSHIPEPHSIAPAVPFSNRRRSLHLDHPCLCNNRRDSGSCWWLRAGTRGLGGWWQGKKFPGDPCFCLGWGWDGGSSGVPGEGERPGPALFSAAHGQREGAALGCRGSQGQSSLLEGRFFMNVRKEKRRINECEGWG